MPRRSILLLLLFVAGCAQTRTVSLRYAPQGRSALGELAPKTASVRVVDDWPLDERAAVSRFKPSAVDPTFTFASDTSPTDVVRRALVDELERAGHRVVSDDGGHAYVPIVVSLRRFWASPSMGTLSELAQIDTEVVVGSAPGAAPVPVSGFFKTTFKRGVFGIFRFDQAGDLNGALADFVHNFTLDPRIRAAFQ